MQPKKNISLCNTLNPLPDLRFLIFQVPGLHVSPSQVSLGWLLTCQATLNHPLQFTCFADKTRSTFSSKLPNELSKKLQVTQLQSSKRELPHLSVISFRMWVQLCSESRFWLDKTVVNLYILNTQSYYIMNMPLYRRCEVFPLLSRMNTFCCVTSIGYTRYKQDQTNKTVANMSINMSTMLYYHQCLLWYNHCT